MLPPPSITPRDPSVSSANREAAARAMAKPVDTSDGAVVSVLEELDAFDTELQYQLAFLSFTLMSPIF